MQAITPSQVASKKNEIIPSFVIDAFNTLIAANFNHGRSDFSQTELMDLIWDKALTSGYVKILEGVEEEILSAKKKLKDEIFKKHWLDVEPIYEKAGWKVEYDKPGYNESGDAYFRLKEK